MADHPAPQPAEVAALLHKHSGRWQIEHTGLGVPPSARAPTGRTSGCWSPTTSPACAASWRTLRPRNRRTSRHRVWRSRRWVDIGRVQPARLIALGKIIRPPGAHPPSSHHNAGGRECLATEAEVGGLPGCRATVRWHDRPARGGL